MLDKTLHGKRTENLDIWNVKMRLKLEYENLNSSSLRPYQHFYKSNCYRKPGADLGARESPLSKNVEVFSQLHKVVQSPIQLSHWGCVICQGSFAPYLRPQNTEELLNSVT